MAQGFVKSLNLSESDAVSDENIFNNLAGAGIVEDIRLFAGNSEKKTTVPWGASNVEDGEIYWEMDDDNWVYIKRKGENEGTVPFSNRTRLLINGSRDYVVSDSDGFTRFKIRNLGDNTVVTDVIEENDLVREDTVTFSNMNFMNLTRLETIVDSGQEAGGGSDTLSTDNGVDTSLTDIYSIGENFNLADNALALYFYKKSRIPRTYEESIFDKRVVFDGALRITNTEGVIPVQGESTAPGLYIVAGTNAVRAFSDTSNPWYEESSAQNSANGSGLATDATRAQVSSLTLEDPNFRNPNSATFGVVSESGDIAHNASTNRIYKMKVRVNGETFYLLLKQ